MGHKFGRLLVVSTAIRPTEAKDRAARWECLCDCGATTIVRAAALVSGHTTSCGCWHAEAIGHRARVHGHSGRASSTPEYRAHKMMRQRCKPNAEHHAAYHDRGISVWPAWDCAEGFLDFLAHVGPRPGDGYSLDRIDNDRGYEPGNVRWSTQKTQTLNRRTVGKMQIEIRRLRQIIEDAGLEC